MAAPKKNSLKKALPPADALPDTIQVQELLAEIADLKREKAEALEAAETAASLPQAAGAYTQAPSPAGATVQSGQDTAQALLNFLSQGAISTTPKDYKKTLNKPYTFTPARKAEIEAIFKSGYQRRAELDRQGKVKVAAKYVTYVGDRGIEWLWDSEAPSVTFRRQTVVRRFDDENSMWVKEKVWVSECLHASIEDRTYHRRLQELCNLT